jgi:hypothetical protein
MEKNLIMKDTPTVKKEVTEKPVVQNLQKEIYLRLISSSAVDGKFDLGKLTSAATLVKVANHLKGVSEILAVTFEGKQTE